MKKSLLALAALTAFAGAASAQSSVTLYGRVDLSVGKNSGLDSYNATTGASVDASKYIQNGSGSRLGFRGVEDLGGGMSALFNIEHRFNADTGADSSGNVRFWGARSIVGLQGGFGQIVFGREYTTAFLGSQLVADPWGWDTVVAAPAGAGATIPAPTAAAPTATARFNVGGTIGITGGGNIAKVRNDSSVTYKIAAGGFSFGAQIAEATDAIAVTGRTSKPVNFNLGYSAGPLVLGFGMERTGLKGVSNTSLSGDNVSEDWMTLNGSYNFGSFKVGAFYGKGDSYATGLTHKSYMLTATAPIGAGEFRAAYGQLKAESEKVNRLFAAGYHYSMSKRTTLYVDMVNNSANIAELVGQPKGSSTGYDVGIKHNF